MDESAGGEEDSFGLKYPKPMTIDSWEALSSAAKTILMQFGRQVDCSSAIQFEDRLICISFRPGTRTRSSEFTVIRKAMPDHPKACVQYSDNPFYIEHRGVIIRTHSEGTYVYRYILELSHRNNKNPDDWGISRELLWI